MAKVYRVQVEILLTADEKALLEHYVKERNQRYKKRGATRNWWTGETVTVFIKRYNLPGGKVSQRSGCLAEAVVICPCLVYKFTQRRRLNVWRLRHKEKILFVC